MEVWSRSYIDENNLLNIAFDYKDFTVEDIRKTMDIIKMYFKEAMNTVQLAGFTINDYQTKNPLAVAKDVLTPIYKILYNLNKIKFSISANNVIDNDQFSSIEVHIDGHGLTYGKLKQLLADRGIKISYNDVEDSDYILKCMSTASVNKLKLFFLLVDKNTTEDYIKYLMSENDKVFIFLGLVKKMDYNVIYDTDHLVVRFNLPIYNHSEFLDFLSNQIQEMSQYI